MVKDLLGGKSLQLNTVDVIAEWAMYSSFCVPASFADYQLDTVDVVAVIATDSSFDVMVFTLERQR